MKDDVAPTKADITPLYTEDAPWAKQVDAFVAFTAAPSQPMATSVAVVLPSALRDLRGKVVLAAADAAVAAAPMLSADVIQPVLVAAVAGATVTKRVMADACERAALALVRDTLDKDIWRQVIDILEDDHVAARLLGVKAVTQLVQGGSPACSTLVSSVAKDALRKAAVDKAVEVRDAARVLVSQARSRFGEKYANALLAALPADVRTRFTMPAQNESRGKPPMHSNKRNPPSNLRDLIKARKSCSQKKSVQTPAVRSVPLK